MKTPAPDFLAILRTLAAHDVRFIVVGGVCAVLHGAPVSTFDLDLVHSRSPDNVRRLLAALQELRASSRVPGGTGRGPDVSHLSSPGHQLLMTLAGPLDLLGAVGGGSTYEELLDEAVDMDVAPGLRVKVLGLEALIRLKEEAGQEKDRAVLPILRRTLEEKKRSG